MGLDGATRLEVALAGTWQGHCLLDREHGRRAKEVAAVAGGAGSKVLCRDGEW